MKAYYGSRFSPNQTMTPEGYLVCLNVPIARAGWYEYLASEIGAEGIDGNQVVKVYRDPEEVFSERAMASFNGKPAADDHPPVALDSENAMTYARGTVTNVRRGQGSDADLLLADLVIHDQRLIDEIRAGKREVSAGYECDYVPNGDGTYRQTRIVGNHVAVVEQGRAGSRVRIVDNATTSRNRVGHDELMAMIDDKAHNHLDKVRLQQSIDEGGPSYVLSKVDPNSLGVEYHESLRDSVPEFDQSKAKPIIVGKDGFVIDGRHRVMSAIKSGIKSIDAYVPERQRWLYKKSTRDASEVDKEAEEASRKYGIAVKKDGHRSPPEGYPSDREQYGDPVNYKYPLDGEHKEAAVEYFNHPTERIKGGYTSEEWAKIGRRIADKLGSSYEYRDGKILIPTERKTKEANDKMPKMKAPVRKRSRVIDWLAAGGLKVFAMDAEPEELQTVVDELVEERHAEGEEPENKEPETTKDDAADQERLKALETQVGELKALLEKALAGKTNDEKTAEEMLDDEIAKADKEGGEESVTVEPDEMTTDDPGPVADPDERPHNPITGDSKRAFLQSIKPIIAAIPDEKTKKQVVDAAKASLQGRSGRNTYAAMDRGVRQQTQQRRQEQQRNVPAQQDYSELGLKIAQQHNPHYKVQA